MYARYIKRILDVVCAAALLLLLSPLMVLLILLVGKKLGRPVIFHQERPGRGERIFKMYKFRTMTEEKDAEGKLLPDEIRLTEFGRKLRSTSLDELPELLNILKGEMSFVGPRPLLIEYLKLYTEEQRHRHDVRPGLTGLAQVNGRNGISWEEKFNWDVRYVNSVSFMVDLKILVMTFYKVTKREGITSGSCSTMEPFTGTREKEMNKKNTIKLLFTSVGRRVELIQAFRLAAEQLQINLILYGVDSAGDAPALFYCDVKETVCRISDAAYIPQLLQICRREKIDLVIPTIDTDLLLLAQEKKKFEQYRTQVLISAPDKIALCRDKRQTNLFFAGCNLKSPVTTDDWKKYKGKFPCFIKPLNGSSSINAFKIENLEELEFYANRIFDYIIQPFIEGTEYTVDIFCDFLGKPVYITPRERIAVRSGEVIKSRLVKDAVIIEECHLLIDQFRPVGPLTVQLIRQAQTGVDYYIEINPRFGGGAPLSMKGGADSAKALLQILSGEAIGYQSTPTDEGTLYCRFDQSIAIPMSPLNVKIKAIVFDLDDTLYPEKEYVKSGFKEICRKIPELEGAEEELWNIFLNGGPAIDRVLAKRNCYSEILKLQCLDIYRFHMPNIQLYPGVENLLKRLRNQGYRLGIITDGRPEGQRAKIKILNLEEMVDEIVITDEIGGTCFRKPSDIPYRIIKEKMEIEFSEMIYIGDNVSKDFTAPRKLGMQYIFFNNEDGLYTKPLVSISGYEIKQIEEAEIIIDVINGTGNFKKIDEKYVKTIDDRIGGGGVNGVLDEAL